MESSNCSNFDFVDFDDFSDPDKIKQNTSKYYRNGENISFDHTTMEYYMSLRKMRMDPIGLCEYDENIPMFEFHYQWNPLTGERLEKDPYGPLCFHPHNLIKYFHKNRLNGLWVNEVDSSEGYYEGYYDLLVGTGEDIYIQSRGYNPDRYLFRLPIIDCYWTPDMCKTAVTLGPKLTLEEVKQIDALAEKCGKYAFSAKRPSLTEMKHLYDMALSERPQLDGIDTTQMSKDELIQEFNAANRRAVDALRKIK